MRSTHQRTRVAVMTAVLAVAIAGYLGAASGVPRVRSPLPLATTAPVLWFWMAVGEASALRWVVDYAIPMLVGPVLLIGWYPRLISGAARVPTRSVVGLVLLSVFTIVDFILGWHYGVTYQGTAYTMVLLFLNAVALTLGWTLLWSARTRQQFRRTLAAHTFIVVWLVWIAFPWLGELP